MAGVSCAGGGEESCPGAFGNLLQRTLARARLFHFLPHCVQLSLAEMTGSRNKRQQRAIENWKTDFARWLSFAKILVNR
jgi:hypothetical protein